LIKEDFQQFILHSTFSKKHEYIALKKIEYTGKTTKSDRLVLAEIYFLKNSIGNESIVQFRQVLYQPTENCIWLVMEYIEGCNLHDTVLRHKYNEKHIAFISHEVLKALKFLHSQEIAHRDIKTQNIMLTLEGNVKLVDFGLSCEMGLGPRTSLVGSPYWMPPEMIKNQPYTYNVDIWSLGICILELFLGAVPYAHSGILCMFKVATEGLIELIPNNISLKR